MEQIIQQVLIVSAGVILAPVLLLVAIGLGALAFDVARFACWLVARLMGWALSLAFKRQERRHAA